MSIDACADMVVRGDPDRALSAMTAHLPGRGDLLVLYAFNLEVARAPWVTKEPMIAEMRLQWWADVIDEIGAAGPVRSHEVATPLADMVRRCGVPVDVLAAIVEARRQDIETDRRGDAAALDAYIAATAGGLMEAAASALAADAAARDVARQAGFASGAANLIRALPALIAAGRNPLPQGETDRDAVAALADRGLAALRRARRTRRAVGREVLPALFAGWQSAAVLKAAAHAPDQMLSAPWQASEFSRRAGLLWCQMTGRF